MSAFLEVDCGLDGQVNGLSEVDQFLFSKILNAFFLGFLIELIFMLFQLFESGDVFLSQDVHLGLLPLFFVLEIFGVVLEDIQILFP
jgi:hypothetical protein